MTPVFMPPNPNAYSQFGYQPNSPVPVYLERIVTEATDGLKIEYGLIQSLPAIEFNFQSVFFPQTKALTQLSLLYIIS